MNTSVIHAISGSSEVRQSSSSSSQKNRWHESPSKSREIASGEESSSSASSLGKVDEVDDSSEQESLGTRGSV